jgi:Uncharacterized conserved protein
MINCLCPTEAPMETRTHIVLLMHPKEYRKQKTGTGRLACLNLANSELLPGLAFDEHPRVRELLGDPQNFCALLYPGQTAVDLSEPGSASLLAKDIAGKRLVVFLIDSTWSCAHAVICASPGLLRLPRLMFRSSEKSRWIIKRQPKDFYLSTIEAIHELLVALESAGLEDYPDKERLLGVFMKMQEYQVARALSDHQVRYIGKGREAEL